MLRKRKAALAWCVEETRAWNYICSLSWEAIYDLTFQQASRSFLKPDKEKGSQRYYQWLSRLL